MDEDRAAMQARLVALESRFALAEDLLDELNRTLFRQQEKLDALAHELVEIRRQQLAAGDRSPGTPADERPPHY